MKTNSIEKAIHNDHHKTQCFPKECFIGADGVALEVQHFHHKVPKLTIQRQQRQYYTTKERDRYHYFEKKTAALRAFYNWVRSSDEYVEDLVAYGVQEHHDDIYVYQFFYDAKDLGFSDNGYREYIDPIEAQAFLRESYKRVQKYEMYFASLLGFRYLRQALQDTTIQTLLTECDADELTTLCTTVIDEEYTPLREAYQQSKEYIASIKIHHARLAPLAPIFELNRQKGKRVDKLDQVEQEFLPRVFKNLLEGLSTHNEVPLSWAIYTGEDPIHHIVEDLLSRITTVQEEAQQFAKTIDSEFNHKKR